MSVNKAVLIGHLGRDPEIHPGKEGRKIATFSIATSKRWRDKASGERHEHTEWHRIVVFNEALAKVVEQYLKKGAKVYVEGEICTRKWTDKANVERYATEIVLSGFHSQIVMLDRAAGGPGAPPDTRADLDDEIPF